MSDLDPIELEFLINSPELLAELQAVSSGMKNHDEVVEKVVKRYDDLKKEQKNAETSTGQMKGKISGLGSELLKTGGNIDQVKEVLGGMIHEVVVSNANISTLTKIKEFWSAVNLRVAATLGISTAAAQALTATLTLGLSLAIGGLILLFQNWRGEAAAAAEQQKKFGETVANTASESISSFMAMRAEWNALGNDLQAKQKYVEDNQDAFASLGIAVDNVGSAENVFRKNAAAMVNSLLERARAMAAMQLAAEELKKSLQTAQEVELREDRYKTTIFGGINRFVNEKIGGALGIVQTDADAKKYEQNAQKFVNQKVKADAKANKIQRDANIKQHEENRKSEQTQLEKDAEVYKARTSKKGYDLLIKNEDNNLKKYRKGTKEWQDSYHQRNILIAEKQHEQDETATKAANKAASEAEKANRKREAEQKRADNEARRHFERQKNFIEKLSAEENAVKNTATSDTTEEAKIKSKYEQMAEDAKKLGLAKNILDRIDAVKNQRLGDAKYKDETKDLLTHLGNMKEIYSAFEAYKDKVGTEEANKRFTKELGDYKTFLSMIQEEISKLSSKTNLSAGENERLKSLKDMAEKARIDAENSENNKYAQALEATRTFEEQKAAINERYLEQKSLLEKRYNGDYLQEKLQLLKEERDAAINSAQEEAIQKTAVFRQLNDGLLESSKAELQARIEGLKKILADGLLTDDQRDKLAAALQKAEQLTGKTDAAVRLNELKERRNLLEQQYDQIADKSARAAVHARQQIAMLDREISEDSAAAKFDQAREWADAMAQIFGELGDAIGDSNEGLADTLATMSELASVVGTLADVGKKASKILGNMAQNLTTGNIVGVVVGIISAIASLFSLRKKARESERKAMEEMKKRQYEIFQSHLDYNAELRKRLLDEAKINDLYQSRADAIREEMQAQKQNRVSTLSDYQTIFGRLMSLQTAIAQKTQKYGGFLGIGRKTKVVDIQQSVGSLLGVGSGAQITDDILRRLEELNAKQPLTGDAKDAYEQLRKLRDEYGSIEQAQRDLEKQLKDTVTGTTAQALADSIREGILSGKKEFADFADDIENFLRKGIIAGMSAKVIEPQIQKLQDELYNYLGDGVLSSDEKQQFQQMYMKIAAEAKDYLDMINQSGISMTTTTASANSLQGAYKAASQESISLLAGQTGGMRIAQLETNQILKSGAAQQLAKSSKMLEVQMNIELNTRKTAENTEKTAENTEKIDKTLRTQYNDLKANGII